jgi:dTDP-4-dehydrorhamnose 3,5-epimerase
MVPMNLEISGAFAFSVKEQKDDRGSLVRIFDSIKPFASFKVLQASYIQNPLAGTLRGIHFQLKQHAETKIVQCVTGKVFDVIVDIEEESDTYGKACSIYLGPEEEFQGIFIPKKCAHGYLTISDNSNLTYFMDKKYSPENSRGIRWNDPTIGVSWPTEPKLIAKKDSELPFFGLKK